MGVGDGAACDAVFRCFVFFADNLADPLETWPPKNAFPTRWNAPISNHPRNSYIVQYGSLSAINLQADQHHPT